MASGVPARISGRLEVRGSATTSSAHQLLSTTPGAIEFLSGSYVQPGSKFTGSLFGSGTANKNSVLFRNGSTYEQATGSTPFGSNTTFQIVNFEPNSLFIYAASGNTVALSGRTYGKLEINTNRTLTISTYSTNPSIIQSDLIITAGVVTINTSNVELRGNLLINGGGLLFNQDANNNPVALTFNGTAAQRIGGTAASTLTFPTNATLALNNAAGLTLERSVIANGPVTLTQGIFNTTNTNRLTLGPVATITGSASSFVQGPLVRQSSAAGALFFPHGKGTAYRPLTLNITTAPSATISYLAEQQEGRPADQNMLDDLRRVSSVRYYSLTPSPVPVAGTFGGTIELSFGADDRVGDPNMASFVVGRSNGDGWDNLGHSANSSNTLTSNNFSSLGNFALGSTQPNQNPLPVSLSSFSAKAQSHGVNVQWTTATEQQNAFFEVERRAEGESSFRVLTKMLGRGTSSAVTTYSFLDNTAQAGPHYYRLRQVDTDGTSTYSAVTAVIIPDQNMVLSLYPNPTAHQLRVLGAGDTGRYRILNEQGIVVLSGEITSSLNLNIEVLRPGLYHVELSRDNQRTVRTFLRTRE
jgi:hypothetical protein